VCLGIKGGIEKLRAKITKALITLIMSFLVYKSFSDFTLCIFSLFSFRMEIENDGVKMKVRYSMFGPTIENEYLIDGDSESYHELIKDTFKVLSNSETL